MTIEKLEGHHRSFSHRYSLGFVPPGTTFRVGKPSSAGESTEGLVNLFLLRKKKERVIYLHDLMSWVNA